MDDKQLQEADSSASSAFQAAVSPIDTTITITSPSAAADACQQPPSSAS